MKYSLAVLIACSMLLGQTPAAKKTAAPVLAKSEDQKRVDEVVKLAEAGLGETVIAAKIRSYGAPVNLGTEDMVRLKKAGASENLILLLIDPTTAPVAASPPPPPKSEQPPPLPVEAASASQGMPGYPKAFGLYYLDKANWVPMPQTQCKLQVNKMRRILGGKLIRQKTHANLEGTSAATRVPYSRPKFLVYFPDRKVSTFNLLRLIPKEGPNIREVAQLSVLFSTEQYQDKIEIEISPAGPANMYMIVPKEDLTPGEYGVVEPPPTSNTEKVALFDVWDFGIGERAQAGAAGAR